MPETVVLDVASLLAAAGVVATVLGALYAARSAKQARRQAAAAEAAVVEAKRQSETAKQAVEEANAQNRISIHNERLRIYKALLIFRSSLSAHGIHFKDKDIWDLWEHVQISEFYFPQPIATELAAIVDAAIAVQSSRSEWSDDAAPPPGERPALIRKSYDLLTELRKRAELLDPTIRQELRLVES